MKKEEVKYNFEKFINKSNIGRRIGERKLTNLDKEIICWLLKSKVGTTKIVRFSKLHLTHQYIKKIYEQSVAK